LPRSSISAAAAAKQVTRKNFAAVVLELGAHLEACDYVVVAAQKTGTPMGWRHALSICNKKSSIALRPASRIFRIRLGANGMEGGFWAKRLFFLPTLIFFVIF
jgi:hypothetical protein